VIKVSAEGYAGVGMMCIVSEMEEDGVSDTEGNGGFVWKYVGLRIDSYIIPEAIHC